MGITSIVAPEAEYVIEKTERVVEKTTTKIILRVLEQDGIAFMNTQNFRDNLIAKHKDIVRYNLAMLEVYELNQILNQYDNLIYVFEGFSRGNDEVKSYIFENFRNKRTIVLDDDSERMDTVLLNKMYILK